MSIVAIGIDLTELDRIAASLNRFGERFCVHILTESEMAALPPNGAQRIRYVAARFAAKEAASKALGTGFAEGVTPLNIEVLRKASGQPVLCLHGAASARAQALGVTSMHLSLTHSRLEAAAVVIFESAM